MTGMRRLPAGSTNDLQVGDLVLLDSTCWVHGWRGLTAIVIKRCGAPTSKYRKWTIMTTTGEQLIVSIKEVTVLQRIRNEKQS